jgi:hypothetical protein
MRFRCRIVAHERNACISGDGRNKATLLVEAAAVSKHDPSVAFAVQVAVDETTVLGRKGLPKSVIIADADAQKVVQHLIAKRAS